MNNNISSHQRKRDNCTTQIRYEIIASSPWVALKGLRNHRVVIRKNNFELMVHYEIKHLEPCPTHYPSFEPVKQTMELVHYFQEGGYYFLSNADALKLAWEDFNDRVERLIRKVGKEWRMEQINNEVYISAFRAD